MRESNLKRIFTNMFSLISFHSIFLDMKKFFIFLPCSHLLKNIILLLCRREFIFVFFAVFIFQTLKKEKKRKELQKGVFNLLHNKLSVTLLLKEVKKTARAFISYFIVILLPLHQESVHDVVVVLGFFLTPIVLWFYFISWIFIAYYTTSSDCGQKMLNLVFFCSSISYFHQSLSQSRVRVSNDISSFYSSSLDFDTILRW